MPQIVNNWLHRCTPVTQRDLNFNPEFSAYNAVDNVVETAGALREAFTFLRRHGSRRYSANTLMSVLNKADRFDQLASADIPVASDESMSVGIARVPFAYDEETEVKTGGIVGVVVCFPDRRTLLAVHENKRRAKLGRSLVMFVTNYLLNRPVYWVHQFNTDAQSFLLSCEYFPWRMNTQGALEFAAQRPTEDSDATEEEDDYALDEAMSRRDRTSRPRRRPVASARTAANVRMAEEMERIRIRNTTLPDTDFPPRPSVSRMLSNFTTRQVQDAHRRGLTPRQLAEELVNHNEMRAAGLDPSTATMSEVSAAGLSVDVVPAAANSTYVPSSAPLQVHDSYVTEADPELERLLLEETDVMEQVRHSQRLSGREAPGPTSCGNSQCQNFVCRAERLGIEGRLLGESPAGFHQRVIRAEHSAGMTSEQEEVRDAF